MTTRAWRMTGLAWALLGGAARAADPVIIYQNGFESADTCAWTTSAPETMCDPEMVFVPAGSFTMGSDAGSADEQPVHTVTLSPFWIDRTEVTTDAYLSCVADSGCSAPNGTNASDANCNYGGSGRGNHPINCIDRTKAEAYCTWASKRLPSEAEWEKAARGTDARTYPWGEELATCDYAIMYDPVTGEGCGAGHTDSVGTRPSGLSPYGALDMAGNAFEWVYDWYDSGYYAVSPSTDPTGPATGTNRCIRGGSWFHDDTYMRSSNRNAIGSATWNSRTGFRCARDAAP